MSLKDVLEIGATIIGSLGGGGAIVLGLSGYLGKFWADHALEREKHKYAEMLQEAQSKMDRAVNRYQVELDTLSLAHKLRTTEEFSHLGKLWRHMAILAADFDAAAGLGLRFVPPAPAEQKKQQEERRLRFFTSLAEANDFFLEERLFIPREVAEHVHSILKVAILDRNLYFSFASHVDPGIRVHYGKELSERISQFMSGMTSLEELMRQHIEGRRAALSVASADAVR